MDAITIISMIGWLKGELAEPWQHSNRYGTLVLCHGVGYEVQLSQRQWTSLPAKGSEIIMYIHTQVRDDSWILFGFETRQERDLFRELVAVSGVGAQMAMALLGVMQADELVQAIVQADLRRLCRAPGVGKRSAERLSVELRRRLKERFVDLVEPEARPDLEAELASASCLPQRQDQEEIQITLIALGYEPFEIQRAIKAVANKHLAESDAAADNWIRECLRWLSAKGL